ncbi:hypothetical protein [Janthinobacterium sp.]|uniref:hypothetical protein n=1 Tax=Janthinobacterium sp. TaxID=1871054 RepID=UPI00258B1542|nr:hypothetical protein [Janthinobacterium sp.]
MPLTTHYGRGSKTIKPGAHAMRAFCFLAPRNEAIMAEIAFFDRFRVRRSVKEVDVIVVNVMPAPPSTHQEVLDQVNTDVVRQFLRMLDVQLD